MQTPFGSYLTGFLLIFAFHDIIIMKEYIVKKPQLLDIEKVLADKSPALKKVLPGFIINMFKRLVHQDKLNSYLTRFGHNEGVDFIDDVLNDMNTKINVIGGENVQQNKRSIIASNHPLGGLDGLALMLAVGRISKDLFFPVNDILLNIENLKPLFIPINKHGSNSENIKIINSTFDSQSIVCYFPFGLVSRKRKGRIEDLEWKSTFISKSIRFKRDIIPTHIDGRNTNFFYNLSNIRKALRIKTNIEMLFLVDEFVKQSNSTLNITFGKPIPYTYFDKRFSRAEWAELLRQYCYKLGEGCNEPFKV